MRSDCHEPLDIRMDRLARDKGHNTDKRCPACGRVVTYVKWREDVGRLTPAGGTGESVACPVKGCEGTLWRYEYIEKDWAEKQGG